LLFARSVPLSRLELRMARLVPRKATRIVLVDDGDGLSQRAAKVLGKAGYSDLSILDGGNPAWSAAASSCFPASTCRARRSASSSSMRAHAERLGRRAARADAVRHRHGGAR